MTHFSEDSRISRKRRTPKTTERIPGIAINGTIVSRKTTSNDSKPSDQILVIGGTTALQVHHAPRRVANPPSSLLVCSGFISSHNVEWWHRRGKLKFTRGRGRRLPRTACWAEVYVNQQIYHGPSTCSLSSISPPNSDFTSCNSGASQLDQSLLN